VLCPLLRAHSWRTIGRFSTRLLLRRHTQGLGRAITVQAQHRRPGRRTRAVAAGFSHCTTPHTLVSGTPSYYVPQRLGGKAFHRRPLVLTQPNSWSALIDVLARAQDLFHDPLRRGPHNCSRSPPIRLEQEPNLYPLDGACRIDGLQGLDRWDKGLALLQNVLGST
jgi:hypothetical protein